MEYRMDPMSKDCQYSKMADDVKCLGCRWKQEVV